MTMTRIWLEHHNEQMEAARAEFAVLWKSVILPQLPGMSPRAVAMAEMAEWNIFRENKTPKNE